MVEGVEQAFGYDELVIWIVLEGSGMINHEGPGGPVTFKTGDSIVIPADLRGGGVKTNSKCMWLEVSIPIRSSLADFERPDRASLAAPEESGQRFVQLGTPDGSKST